MDRICVIMNPEAGDGRAVAEIRRLCGQRADLELREIRGKDQTEWLANEMALGGCRTLAIAGGDGTLGQVVNGLAKVLDKLRIGILPTGSANDFSKSLGLPRDVSGAMDVIDSGKTRSIDLIRACYARPRLLLNAATGGLSTEIEQHMDPELKARWRGLAYVRAAVAALPGATTYQVRADIDGERLEIEVIGVLIANGQYAGGLRLAPSASPRDHRLDVAMVASSVLDEKVRVAGRLAVGTHLSSEHVLVRRARRVRLESVPAMAFHSDGEPFGAVPVTFEIVPDAVQVFAADMSE
jgi:diacylglycerol kinase (ATP)